MVLFDTVNLPLVTPISADKGYESDSNRDYLRAYNCTDCIMYKKPKGEELCPTKACCKIGGSVQVGSTFGSVHTCFEGGLARYHGLAKTHTQSILEFMAYNMKRMLRLEIREFDVWNPWRALKWGKRGIKELKFPPLGSS